MATRPKSESKSQAKKQGAAKTPSSPDAGFDAFAKELGLDPETLDSRIARAEEHALETLKLVRPRFEDLYQLKLPIGLAHLYALFHALGELPENPAQHYWQPEAGFERGSAWMDSALSVRPSGLLDWFAPGGLDRKCFTAEELLPKNHPSAKKAKKTAQNKANEPLPLDARLDMRYRCDAPQFVTFLGGDSDGLHWGFWYDSPDFYPIIAHNYARDSAETWLDGESLTLAFLRVRATEIFEENAEELELLKEDNEARPYAIRRRWALRVVQAHLDALDRLLAKRSWPEEPHCPWPRTKAGPVGNPSLALKPRSGRVPTHIPGMGKPSLGTPSVQKRKLWLKEAQDGLKEGNSAYAHVLGLYLHWLDADELREEAGQLLVDAYQSLGFKPFADILKLHLEHRDLPSVAVFKDAPDEDE